jgi:DNA-binding transcriptional MerR regulator
MLRGLGIGDLARATGVKVPTIRYYEQIGLMPSVDRTEGNQRRYGQGERRRLAFVKHARDLGFSIEEIRDLLALSDHPERSCNAVHAIAAQHIEAIERRLAQLSALKSELSRIAESCAGGKHVAECRVIHTLADHGLRAQEHPDGKIGVN